LTVAFPIILFAILFVVVWAGMVTTVFAVALVLWARYAQVIRGEITAYESGISWRRRNRRVLFMRIMLIHLFRTFSTLVVLLVASGLGDHRRGLIGLLGANTRRRG
jgi:NADH:ubiquinone oxidoreductase subunit 3 (subunit A)